MARQFGIYNPAVPLGTTWEEQFAYEDAAGPVDLTGFDVRAQFYSEQPVRLAGDPDPDPVFEITTPGYYVTPPIWPLIEGFDISGATDGRITLSATVEEVWLASPENTKAKLRWSVTLVEKGTGYTLPFLSGAVVFLPARTM